MVGPLGVGRRHHRPPFSRACEVCATCMQSCFKVLQFTSQRNPRVSTRIESATTHFAIEDILIYTLHYRKGLLEMEMP